MTNKAFFSFKEQAIAIPISNIKSDIKILKASSSLDFSLKPIEAKRGNFKISVKGRGMISYNLPTKFSKKIGRSILTTEGEFKKRKIVNYWKTHSNSGELKVYLKS